MNERGVEDRHIDIGLIEQHADLCATENEAVCTGASDTFCDLNVDQFAGAGGDVGAALGRLRDSGRDRRWLL